MFADFATKFVTTTSQFSGLGLLVSSTTPKPEGFEDKNDKMSTTDIIILVVVLIVLAGLIPYSTYNIMCKSVLHAVLSFFFGILYILLVWLWAGLFTKRQLKN